MNISVKHNAIVYNNHFTDYSNHAASCSYLLHYPEEVPLLSYYRTIYSTPLGSYEFQATHDQGSFDGIQVDKCRRQFSPRPMGLGYHILYPLV